MSVNNLAGNSIASLATESTFSTATTIEDRVWAAASAALPSSVAHEDPLFLDGFRINIEGLMNEPHRQIPNAIAATKVAASLQPTFSSDGFLDPFADVLLTDTPAAKAPAALSSDLPPKAKEKISKKRQINKLSTKSVDSLPLSTPTQMADGSPSLEKHTLTNPKLRQCLPWTPEDEALLCSHSSLKEAKNAPEFRHHSKIAIEKKWKDLKRRAKMDPLRQTPKAASGERWSQEELQALQDSPTLEDALNSPKLQKRSPRVIKHQWKMLHRTPASSNTPSLSPLPDDDIPLTPLLTRETEEVDSTSESAPALFESAQPSKRSKSSHEENASLFMAALSIPAQHTGSFSKTPDISIGKHWSKEELQALQNSPTLEDALKVPELKRRSQLAIRRKWLELHPEDKKTSRPWTREEDAILCSYTSLQEAQKSPELLSHRTPIAIKTRWLRLKSLTKKDLESDFDDSQMDADDSTKIGGAI